MCVVISVCVSMLFYVQDLNSGKGQKQLFHYFLTGLTLAKLDDSFYMGASYSCGKRAHWSQALLRSLCSATC